MRFDQLHLPEALMRAIHELGFQELTAVQERALPLALAGKDVAGQGRTGTGKTAAFLITTFAKLLQKPAMRGRKAQDPRALIIAPTRELAVQIHRDAQTLGKYTGLKLHCVYGGVDYDKQRSAFAAGVDVLIGTPGRLIDYFKQRCFGLKHAEILVIDEADRMFDLGFIRDLRYLLRRLPPFDQRQSLMFSATLSYRVLELAYEYMNDPEKLRAEEGEITAEGIEESLYQVAMDEKFRLLVALLRQQAVERGMIFINEKRTGERLARDLARYGFAVGLLSGDVRQQRRLKILKDFEGGRLRLLVATDVASRGLHIENVSHVINYDLPQDAEDYVHRIGRTARAGATGVAISFSCERFCFSLPDIERYIGHKIPTPDWDHALLDIGPPPQPRAEAAGTGREDKQQPRPGKPVQRSRRRRTGSRRR